jgi:Mce-associated membrane protein
VTKDENTNAGEDEPTLTETSEAVELTEPSNADEPASAVDEPASAVDEDDAKAADRKAIHETESRGARRYIGVILVAAALVLSAGLASWLYFFEYRNGDQTDAAASNAALDAAKSGTVSLLSYSPDTLDKDFTAAKSNLTGDFLSYYTQFTTEIVTPAAKEKQVKTTASVVRAGVSEIHPDSAVVLVFINQVTTSKENPDGAFAASAVKVGLTKLNDRWLISAFDPV